MSTLLDYINNRVGHYQNLYNVASGRAFMMWYAVEAIELDESAAFEAVSYDGGNDKGIDLFYVDDEAERIIIAQGKYSRHGKSSPKVGDLLELVHAVNWLDTPESLERDGRPDLAAAAVEYKDAVSKGYSLLFYFIYLGPKKKELVDAATSLNNQDNDQPHPRSVRLVDVDVLELIHEEAQGGATRVPEYDLTVEPDKVYEQSGRYGRALIATVPGQQLQNMYATHGDALFDRNVRLYLGERKGSVNAGIRDTLSSETERQNFWAYNNGLTIICDSFRFDRDSGHLHIDNFSIVNGCQTTVSVATSSNGAAKDVAILARFISASDDQVVDSIIRYTNSQTPIRQWDITSRDKIQKRLKAEFAKEPFPFFYELRHGEARSISTEEKKRLTRDGRFQSITYDQLAQYLAAFDGLPTVAYKDKGRLFTTHRDDIFPKDLCIEKAIFVWLATEAAEEAVRDKIKDATERNQTERLHILKRGGKLFNLAVMAVILRERNGAHYLSRLRRESAGSHKMRERLEFYARLAVTWYVEAARSVLRAGPADITKLVRSQDFFKEVEEKVLTSWEVQSMDRSWLQNALPKIGT